ncbi:MAG: hypothetical protein HKL95_07590 [Phycisphaerae bacterium]|nr:hypothetical protein [Phycisphaerae bacterium]
MKTIFRSILCMAWGLMCMAVPLTAPARAVGPAMLDARNMKIIGCAPPDTQYEFVTSNEPGNVFFPGEAVNLQIRVAPGAARAGFLKFSVGRIAMYQDQYLLPGVAMMVPKGVPEIEFLGWKTHSTVSLRGGGSQGKVHALIWRGHAKVAASYLPPAGKGGEMLQVRDLPVPQRYGCYVVTVAPEGKHPQFLCTLLRAHRIAKGFNTAAPILGEAALMTDGSRNNPALLLRGAETYARLGVKIVRYEAHWTNVESKRGVYDWSGLDNMMHAMTKAQIRTMWTVDAAPFWTMPFGQPTPACIPTKADWSCEPKYLPLFKKWLTAACNRYWDHGHGSLWVLENWNEPWEGISISGWESDTPHYRAIMKVIAQVAHAQKPPMKTAAACSIMNTEDKFLSGRHPARQIKMVDIFTDHYVQPQTCYGPMVAAYWHKQSMDTETWVACNEMMVPQVMTQFMADGQLHVNPCFPLFIYFATPGSPMTYTMPTPVALACNTFNYFITGKPFQRLVFMHHLPFAFQFGRGSQAVVVLLGRLFTPFGNSLRSVLWWQFNLTHGGTMSFSNADGAIHVYNIDGNRVFVHRKTITLPVNTLAYYLTCPKGGVKVIRARLAAAQYQHVRPVEIIAHDFTQWLHGSKVQLHTTLHNLLPQKITGTLTITPPADIQLASTTMKVTLASGQTMQLTDAVTHATPDRANVYPFAYHFSSSCGTAAWKENLHVLVVPHATIPINGNLAAWKHIPGVLVAGHVQGTPAIEKAWLPFVKQAAAHPGKCFAQVKLAWDKSYFYVLARVQHPQPCPPHIRLATRNDNQYFRSAADDALCASLAPYAKFIFTAPWYDPLADPPALKKDPLWPAYQAFLQAHPAARDEVTTGAAGVYLKVHPTHPKATFADATYVYKKNPGPDAPWHGDTFQFALHVVKGYNARNMILDTNRLPAGFHAMPDTDYEYALYGCQGGGSELWCLLSPGMPREHYYPRQPQAAIHPGVVAGGLHLVKQEGAVTIYEAAIPWSALSRWHPQTGHRFRFTFVVHNNNGPRMVFGANASSTKLNGLTLHPYWETSPSCSVQWRLLR